MPHSNLDCSTTTAFKVEKTCLLLISVPPPRIMTHIFHKNVVLLFQRHLTVRNLPFLRKIAVNLVLMWVVRLKQLSGVPRTLQFPPIPNRREPKRLNAKNTAHFIATQVIKLNHCVLSPLPTPRGGEGTWVNVCWVCAAGLSEPLPHYSLFLGQL